MTSVLEVGVRLSAQPSGLRVSDIEIADAVTGFGVGAAGDVLHRAVKRCLRPAVNPLSITMFRRALSELPA
ncbi:hypothetical protein C6A87_004290 [Mycobacterium sp. ITM-2016-00317]|uniref:hypothetical protein n=1 Tax=Mycobacterium sp. ITM-2016-00317 TaxID=2099694 RepID=UPI00287FBF8B|nr:hypothetical protein [Mycobacterium sp. ITM-2016-00317]WNG88472.1 hypothetical protein C6A87_004290 [Mycobacterium sp. ITM-2016-00317]